MATTYLNEIRQFQPSGPYLIAGICFGGYVAWEMAQRLKREGQQVALVAMLDSVAPQHGPTWSNRSSRAASILQRMSESWTNGQLLRFIRNAIWWRVRWWRHRWTAQKRRVWRLIVAHTKAQLSYVASPLDGSILFLQSEEYSTNPKILERWAALATGDFESIVIPGTMHRDLLLGTKFSPQLAAILREHLDRLREDADRDELCSIRFPQPTAVETRRAA